MSADRPVPIGELCRIVVMVTERALPVMLDAAAWWGPDGWLTVQLPAREIRLQPFTREQLLARWGERVGNATHGWLIDDGSRLALVRPGGGLVIWAYNPRALDEAAAELLELFERRNKKQVAQAA